MRAPTHRMMQDAPPSVPFSLPMMTYISVLIRPDRTVAHALDFDIVAVAPTESQALAKLRLALKYHVEFGIRLDIQKDILFKAPERFWAQLTPESNLSIGEPLEVNSHKIRTLYSTTSDEHNVSVSAA